MTHVTAQSTSNLDRCLISEDWISSAQWNPLLRATHTLNFGHRIVQMQLRVQPAVLNNPRHRKHDIIPASIFMPGKDGNRAQAGTEALQGLIRLLHRTCALCHRIPPWGHAVPSSVGQPTVAGEELSSSPCDSFSDLTVLRYCWLRQGDGSPFRDTLGGVDALISAHFSFSACFWAWWKSQPNPKRNDTLAPAFLARKYRGGQSHYINVPKAIVVDLITRSRGAVLNDTNELTTCGDAFILPRIKLHDMLEVIDTLSAETTFLPFDEANAQARGLGNLVAFWERMRNVCPRINTYNGPILTRDGNPCRTADDLDSAM